MNYLSIERSISNSADYLVLRIEHHIFRYPVKIIDNPARNIGILDAGIISLRTFLNDITEEKRGSTGTEYYFSSIGKVY